MILLKWKDKVSHHELRQQEKVKNMLRYLIPRKATRSNQIALAGSTALRWYQIETGCGPFWHDTSQNVDIFVTGWYARKNYFYLFVDGLIDSLERCNRTIESVEKRLDPLVYPHDVVAIVDIKIKGVDKKLSFIQRHQDHTVQDAAWNFDIDLGRVLYHIHRQTFQLVGFSLRDHILSGRGRMGVKEFHLRRFDYDRTVVALNRLFRYRSRGFNATWSESTWPPDSGPLTAYLAYLRG